MNVHLVDGTFELFRAYFSSPPRSSPEGAEIGAVRGLARSLLGLLRDPDVTHVGVAFDHVVESFRNELFPGYKTAEGIDPELLAQFPLAEDVARALGLVTWPMVEFEADDAIATAARRFAAETTAGRVVICSPDKDFAQCVEGNRIVCFDRIRRRTLDAAGVVEKFGVEPESIPDWLALVGDSADGIPGIPRWGAKSAAAVLAVYGRLDRIPDDELAWDVEVRGAGTLARNLRESRDDALLYRRLATLRDDVPLTESLADLAWHGPDEAGLERIAATTRDGALLERALSAAVRR